MVLSVRVLVLKLVMNPGCVQTFDDMRTKFCTVLAKRELQPSCFLGDHVLMVDMRLPD